MRAHRRQTCLPIPKSAESIQRHFFFFLFFVCSHLLEMTQSFLEHFGWGGGGCATFKKSHFYNAELQ